MNALVKQLRNLILTLEGDLKKAKEDLSTIERDCSHSYEETVRDDEVRPAGSSPGDPPGTMGSDWRGPCSWPEKRTPRWRKTCSKCGKTVWTKNHKPAGKKPVF